MKKSVVINASQEAVWNAIISYRTSDPAKRKVKSSSDGKAVVEETFGGVPVVGGSRVVYEELEKPFERIDYHLIESDKLSKFQGAWSLADQGDGKTKLDLTVELDTNLPLPFKESILNGTADKDMDNRLKYVKRTAEGRS